MSDWDIADEFTKEGWELFVKSPFKTAKEIALEVAKNNGYEEDQRVISNLTWVLKGWTKDFN